MKVGGGVQVSVTLGVSVSVTVGVSVPVAVRVCVSVQVQVGLADEVNPHWDGCYPVDMLSWKIDLETSWSQDEVQGVKRLQEAINRIGDAYTKNVIMNSVVRVILDHGALSPTERNKLSNTAAEIIEKAPGRDFSYQVPPSLPGDTLAFVERLMGWTEKKIGVIDSPAMKRVPSIITGPALEGLQLMVETPLRSAARKLENFYQRIGQKLISRVFQYYTADRVLHIIGPSEEWLSFEFQRKKILIGKDGKARSEEDIRKAWRDFIFLIEPGSSLPITRVQRAMMKFQLFNLGLIPGADILTELGVPNPKEKIQQAQIELQSGAVQRPQPPAKGGGGTGGLSGGAGGM